MKVAALGAFLLATFVSELFARHDAQGDLGAGSIILGYGFAAIVAAVVLGYTAFRFEKEREWRRSR